MFRNQYDNDASTWSPQGRIFQVEYASEAVKQGSAVVGLRSKDHVVLVAVKRSPNELASYQKKIIRIDDHMGIAMAGLTSDARVLSNYLRSEAMRSKVVYGRPLPINRAVTAIGDKAQVNTQEYGRRPYGVGLLVIGHDDTGPHLYEFNPSGIVSEYYAYSIGARSQSARTNLERNFETFESMSLKELIVQGLRALGDTLQQGKQLDTLNTSIGFVGKDTKLTILDGEDTQAYLDLLEEGDAAGEGEAMDTDILNHSPYPSVACCGSELQETRAGLEGWGVRAKVGEVISFEEAERRGMEDTAVGLTYLFDLDKAFEDHEIADFSIDAKTHGNISHFFNHSCDPNMEIRPVYIEHRDPRLHRLAFFATRDIAVDEELTFDYNPAASTDSVKFACHRGSKCCRKFIFF